MPWNLDNAEASDSSYEWFTIAKLLDRKLAVVSHMQDILRWLKKLPLYQSDRASKNATDAAQMCLWGADLVDRR